MREAELIKESHKDIERDRMRERARREMKVGGKKDDLKSSKQRDSRLFERYR